MERYYFDCLPKYAIVKDKMQALKESEKPVKFSDVNYIYVNMLACMCDASRMLKAKQDVINQAYKEIARIEKRLQ